MVVEDESGVRGDESICIAIQLLLLFFEMYSNDQSHRALSSICAWVWANLALPFFLVVEDLGLSCNCIFDRMVERNWCAYSALFAHAVDFGLIGLVRISF